MIGRWHVVSTADGGILAVYGSALASQALSQAHYIAQTTGIPCYLHSIVGSRPRVGESISMKGCIQEVYAR